ncbi:MAG TPA: DUF3301 domain-containing protein [Methylophilaceae bacterium]|nr:DUF3301 domain-containing protein [Methylophilaceae bacterium]HAJ70764.1 DUF3301 domain-containing protein [Methylophilaceae bacterium]
MEIILLIILILGAWFWLDSVAKREIAVNFGQSLANRCQLQLLDETVACTKMSVGRDSRGHAQFQRFYEFEVTANGTERMQCHLQLLGDQLISWHIPPYLQPVN